jgi:hypothetical protein
MKFSCCVLVAILNLCQIYGVIVRSYNEVNFVDYTSFADLDRDVFNFGGGKGAKTNVMLGVATPDCADQLITPSLRGYTQ